LEKWGCGVVYENKKTAALMAAVASLFGETFSYASKSLTRNNRPGNKVPTIHKKLVHDPTILKKPYSIKCFLRKFSQFM